MKLLLNCFYFEICLVTKTSSKMTNKFKSITEKYVFFCIHMKAQILILFLMKSQSEKQKFHHQLSFKLNFYIFWYFVQMFDNCFEVFNIFIIFFWIK